MRTTTTLIVRDSRGLLVDPGWRPRELVALAGDLDAIGVQVTAGLATHAHHDHLLWHPRFGNAPRWASAGTVSVVAQRAEELHTALLGDPGDPFDGDVLALFGKVEAIPGSGHPGATPAIPDAFGPGGADEPFLAVVHDAHAPGHTAVWAPERNVLLVGDMLSDIELPQPFDPDDVPAYLAGLDVLAPYVAQASVLVPGHGTPTFEPKARLDADRRYLDAVLTGRVPDDARLANPGMREVHERLVAMVRTTQDGPGGGASHVEQP